MTTSLQQAAQDMLGAMTENSWLNSYEKLRMALEAELAQSTEPVAWRKLRSDGITWALLHQNVGWKEPYNLEPLYLHPAMTVPEGYALVPIEPTKEMLLAGRNTPCTSDEDDVDKDYRAVFMAMIAAHKMGVQE